MKNVKPILIIISFIMISLRSVVLTQDLIDDKVKELDKSTGIIDRAGNTHNASNIGLFFENRGKLYSRRLSQGPDLEFPINSGKHYGYRQNPMVGIPGNVVQGRFTTNEEWEAVGGYHNRELAKVAFSDNPNTWPPTGWPVKDENGNPIIKSDQDSYCVYSDSNNSVKRLGLFVAQTGYAYGISFAKNLLFFKFEIMNRGDEDLDSVYFCMYFDCNVGNVSGGDPEYADDFIGFIKEKNCTYFYDDGYTSEWPDNKTGYMGLTFLKTPLKDGVELGITDMHYSLYDDDKDIDSILYGIMSSSPSLYNSPLGSKYFHLGSNTSLHYDDPATIPPTGLDLVTYNSSGPYQLKRGDTLVFIIAFVAGETYQEFLYYLDQAHKIMAYNFEITKPPITPRLTAIPGDKRVTLYWDDKAEYSFDNFSGLYDFEGYRLYRSMDRGVNWAKIADFDVPFNKIGADKGIQYSYTDTNVINGFEYWYSVTAYDRGDTSIPSLESPKGSNTMVPNTKSAIPLSAAIDRIPVSAGSVTHIQGNSNYILQVNPVDLDDIGNNSYEVGFTYTVRQEIGKPLINVQVLIPDSSKTVFKKYGIQFESPKTFYIIDFSTGEPTSTGVMTYQNNKIFPVRDPNTGTTLFTFRMSGPSNNAPLDSFPKLGDLISIAFSTYCIRNNTDTVIYPRPFFLDKPQATIDGVIFKMTQPSIIQDVSRIGGSDNFEMSFSVVNSSIVKNETYLISVDKKSFDNSGNGFIAILIRNSKMDTIYRFDSLYNMKTFDFNGIRGKVQFPPNSPPSPGNIYSVTTIIPVAPNIRDKYRFEIFGSSKSVQKISDNISKIKVVPNPYIVSSLFEPEFGQLRREPLRQIQFINLPSECTIYIFTLDGDLIKTIYHSSITGTAIWDLRADGGREISAGIYLYVVKTKEIEYLNRFAIIK